MGLPGSVYRKLQKILGKPNITIKIEDLLCYSYDATGKSYLPDAVLFPESETQISKIMALASKHKIIVIPRGAGSGMTGGAVPVTGGIVLVTSRMNRIIKIDENNFFIRVEPGVVTADLHKKVEALGLFYPPDPASSAICTIGGNIGECAGGPRAVKYGVTRDYVMGLRAVLPSGEVIRTGVTTVKGVAGYDLTRLIVGSEGTLAVVTEITLRLLPKPQAVKTMAVIFNSMSKAALTVSAIIREAIVPRCVEYMDKGALNLVENHLAFELTSETQALLILEIDGNGDTVENDSSKIEALCKAQGAVKVIPAEDQAQADRLWAARKALSPVMYKIASAKINEDIVVPIDRIPDMIAQTRQIEKDFNIKVVVFGHAGDGNLHCNILYDKSNKDQQARAQKACEKLFEATLDLGGTITGEHGVGITKKSVLPLEVGPVQLELMKGIKAVFDPLNILNPGKIF